MVLLKLKGDVIYTLLSFHLQDAENFYKNYVIIRLSDYN